MREGIIVEVSAADRARLEAMVADRNSPQKHVWRARIVLLTAAGRLEMRERRPAVAILGELAKRSMGCPAVG
jgi:hypothetical protein